MSSGWIYMRDPFTGGKIRGKSWAGLFYSSVAEDARSKGMKVRGGIDGSHQILKFLKEYYPEVHDELREDPFAWHVEPIDDIIRDNWYEHKISFYRRSPRLRRSSLYAY